MCICATYRKKISSTTALTDRLLQEGSLVDGCTSGRCRVPIEWEWVICNLAHDDNFLTSVHLQQPASKHSRIRPICASASCSRTTEQVPYSSTIFHKAKVETLPRGCTVCAVEVNTRPWGYHVHLQTFSHEDFGTSCGLNMNGARG